MSVRLSYDQVCLSVCLSAQRPVSVCLLNVQCLSCLSTSSVDYNLYYPVSNNKIRVLTYAKLMFRGPVRLPYPPRRAIFPFWSWFCSMARIPCSRYNWNLVFLNFRTIFIVIVYKKCNEVEEEWIIISASLSGSSRKGCLQGGTQVHKWFGWKKFGKIW